MHKMCTHFPKDPNCEVCKHTVITKAAIHRQFTSHIPRETKFGEIISADHKVLSQEGGSRNSLSHENVVQSLVTEWIQSCQTRTKTSNEATVHWNNEKLEKIFNGTHVRVQQGTSEIAGGAARRVEEDTSTMLPQSVLDEQWWWESHKCCYHLRNFQYIRKTP